ncbi:hypothetical protein PHYSODRAFT_419795, partial [Phytophthora sojae]
VPPALRKIYTDFSLNYNLTDWPRSPDQSTPPRGNDGQRGAQRTDTANGFPSTSRSTPTSLRCLPSSTG